jgi:bifunctional NMN adenylyltransferase/nudix hydrolase
MLGTTVTKVTRNNPLDFPSRKAMIQEAYPEVIILPIRDMQSDEVWSNVLDARIREIFDSGSVTLYGSRDGFIPYYKGKFKTQKLAATLDISGTKIRQAIAEDMRSSAERRKGMIFAAWNRHATGFPCIDAAIIRGEGDKRELCLGHKKGDGKNRWRFIGGFFDPTKDRNIEDTVVREVSEEAPEFIIGTPTYAGSHVVDDWRYRHEPDKIITFLFVVPYLWGAMKASDDIDDLQWVSLERLESIAEAIMVEEHKPLVKILLSHLKKEK